MKKLQKLLKKYNAPKDFIDFTKEKSIDQVINECPRSDWILVLSAILNLPLTKIILARVLCAETFAHHIKDERSIKAIEIAKKFAVGEATKDELEASYVKAYEASCQLATEAVAASFVAFACDADSYTGFTEDDCARRYSDYDLSNKYEKERSNICREVLGEELSKAISNKLKEKR